MPGVGGFTSLGMLNSVSEKERSSWNLQAHHPLGMVASGWSSAPNSAYGNCSAPPSLPSLPNLPPPSNHLWESKPAGGWPCLVGGQQEWGGKQGEVWHGGAESNMLGWELQRKKRQTLGQKKERESNYLHYFFPNIFILPALPNFSTHLKQVRKQLMKMIPLLGVTQITRSPPNKTEINRLNLWKILLYLMQLEFPSA